MTTTHNTTRVLTDTLHTVTLRNSRINTAAHILGHIRQCAGKTNVLFILVGYYGKQLGD